MLQPLKSMYVTGPFGERAVPGTGLADKKGIKRHIGVDLRASVGTPVYTPGNGVVRLVDNSGLKLIEVEIEKKYHRFLHLSRNILKGGQKFKQGQIIGYTGDTGGVLPHLHWDVRKRGTTWNSSFYNYEDPIKLLKEEDMKLSRGQAIRLERFITMNHSPTQKQIKEATGKDLTAHLIDRYNDGDFVKNKQIVRTKYPDALKRIKKLEKQVGQGSSADKEDANRWRQFISWLPFVKKGE